MRLLSAFKRKSRLFYVYLSILGVVNGLIFSGILIYINFKISERPLPVPGQFQEFTFFMLLVVSFIVSKHFQTRVIRLANNLAFGFETSVLAIIRNASFQTFERVGAQQVYAIIGDTHYLSFVPEVLINILRSMVIILCALGCLFYVSFKGAIGIISIMLILFLIYLMRNEQLKAKWRKIRGYQDDFFRYLTDSLDGFREVKMSSVRNETLFSRFLKRNREESMNLNISTSIQYLDNQLLGTYSWYLVIGLIIFVLSSALKLSQEETVAFVILLLYLMSPVSMLVSSFPVLTRAKIAMERIAALDKVLKTSVEEDGPDIPGGSAAFKDDFRELYYEKVHFHYVDGDGNNETAIGPITLKISKGELLFITGGNGSGKSTFINIIAGLYKPTSGKVFYNGSEIDPKDYPAIRERMSVIFTANHLFNENYDQFDLNFVTNPCVNEYLQQMKMDGVVKMKGNVFDPKVSKGQQKRLAMIYALLENREILVLDEWAADQDPEFRKYFYEEILPRLMSTGKTVIMVTHDDNYFKHADRLIKFVYGKIVEDIVLSRSDRTVHQASNADV